MAFSPIISTIYKDKIRGEELEKIGSKNAISYIEEKYGFTPEIISVKAKKVDSGPIPVPAIQREYTGSVEVELKYNNKNFRVYTAGEENSQYISDNYQQDEIISSILNIIGEYKGDYYSYSLDNDTCSWKTYYNGSNIKDFLDEFILTINYINNSDIENSNNEIASLFEKGDLWLYNFKSEELLKEYQDMDFGWSAIDERFSKYLDKIICIRDGNIKIYNY